MFSLWIVELFQKRTVQMSKLQRSFFKVYKTQTKLQGYYAMQCFATISDCSATVLWENFDENVASVGTMVSLGIIILVGILAVRNKIKKTREMSSRVFFVSLRISSTISFENGNP